MIRIIIFLLLIPFKVNALIEVDITRGNLNPLPIAVSPLSIDEKSKKSFEKILKRKNIGEEIASVVEFLISGNSSYINGQDLIVDGGWSKNSFYIE